MLSKNDILKEIGKGICIYPLNLENIKENSLNLCVGRFAWATTSRTIYYCEKEYDRHKRFSLKKGDKYTQDVLFKRGHSAVLKWHGGEYVVFLPYSTTLVETKEVLSLNNYIGGTYHSKVGIVSKGIGHIGTMVGPNFSGDSLIAVHNVSDNIIVFHYLDTPYLSLNPTISGHTDKFSELGLHITDEQASELNQDWKKNFEEVKKRMEWSSQYDELQRDLEKRKKDRIKEYLSKKNIIVSCVIAGIALLLYYFASKADAASGKAVWADRFFNVGFSGCFVWLLSCMKDYFHKNSKR